MPVSSSNFRGLTLAVLLCSSLNAWSVDVLDYDLRRLDQVGQESLDRYRGTPTLLMFFEPQCSWCLKQAPILHALTDADKPMCVRVQSVLIGANGTRAALRQWLQRMHVALPAYQISKDLERDMGGIKTTPITLLADAEGQFVTYFRGYQRRTTLTRAIQEQLCTQNEGAAPRG